MKRFFSLLITSYQKWISPAFAPRCKYYPSCSTYTLNAIQHFGLKGLLLAVWRLLRCNPWSNGGVDYVPNKFTFTTHHDKSNKTLDLQAELVGAK